MDKALGVLNDYGDFVDVWVSIPCTGGSTWQHINRKKEAKARKRLQVHLMLFRLLWNNFVIVAKRAHELGATVTIEWPRSCSYWYRHEVRRLIWELKLVEQNFDGCMYGVKSIQKATLDIPIKKLRKLQHLARS